MQTRRPRSCAPGPTTPTRTHAAPFTPPALPGSIPLSVAAVVASSHAGHVDQIKSTQVGEYLMFIIS